MKYLISLFCIFIGAFILTGCSAKGTKITLLPEEGGKIGAISVADTKGVNYNIDKAYSSLDIYQRGEIEKKVDTEKNVKTKYAEVLNALPKKPQSILFYFPNNSAELNPNQIIEIKDISKIIRNSNIIEILCIGHSDSTGDKEYNKTLSFKRAQSVASILMNNIVDKSLIKVEYYGDSDPLVKTAKNRSNAKNRRVEIILK
jgi:outer membrane protein OmpA-like peptidoglycan-associated protein